jgi:hypothetical protein
MYYFTGQTILLRDTLKLASIVKKLDDNERYLCSYYDENNKFKYKVITEMDVMDEEEYEIYRKRMNSINELLKD